MSTDPGCADCGAPLTPEARWCGRCGAPIPNAARSTQDAAARSPAAGHADDDVTAPSTVGGRAHDDDTTTAPTHAPRVLRTAAPTDAPRVLRTAAAALTLVILIVAVVVLTPLPGTDADRTGPTDPTDPGPTDQGPTEPGLTDPTDQTDPGQTDPGPTEPGDDAVVLPDAPDAQATTSAATCGLLGEDDACIAWQVEIDVGATAAVSRGRVIIAAGDGTVRAVNAATGEPQWTTQLDAAGAVRLLPVVASTVPVAIGDRVVFLDIASGTSIGAALGVDPDAAIDANAWLLTVDGATIRAVSVTGDVSWQREIGSDERPVLTSGAPYVITGSEQLTRLFGTTGAERWTTRFDGPIDAVVASGSDAIVHTSGQRAALVGVSDRGEQRWRQPISGELRHLVADTRTAVAVVATDTGDVVVVLDAVRGTIRDLLPLGVATDTAVPVLTGDHVVIARGAPTPQLLVLDADDGSTNHRLRLDDAPRLVLPGQPTTALVATERSLVMVSLTTGRPLWDAQLGAGTTLVTAVPPIVTDGRSLRAIDPTPTG